MRTRIFLNPSNNVLVGNYNPEVEHVHVVLDSSVAAFSVQLPDVTQPEHKEFIFYNYPSDGVGNAVTLVPVTGQLLINTDTSHVLQPGDTVSACADLKNRWLLTDVNKVNPFEHPRLHALDSTIDHSSTIDEGYLMKGDANGLPAQATNTDAEVAAAVSASHAAATVSDSTSIDMSITGQEISASAKFGTASGTVCEGNDSRLSDARTPTTHTHSKLVASDGSPDPALSVDAAGKVGFGTPTPGAKIDLAGGTGAKLLWYNDRPEDGGGTKAGIYLDQFSLQNNSTLVFGSAAAAPGTFIIAAKDTGVSSTTLSEKVRIAGETGNVGIGTTGALAKLAVNGGVHVGGDSDPGDNNLLVDGTTTVIDRLILMGNTAKTAIRGDASSSGGVILSTFNGETETTRLAVQKDGNINIGDGSYEKTFIISAPTTNECAVGIQGQTSCKFTNGGIVVPSTVQADTVQADTVQADDLADTLPNGCTQIVASDSNGQLTNSGPLIYNINKIFADDESVLLYNISSGIMLAGVIDIAYQIDSTEAANIATLNISTNCTVASVALLHEAGNLGLTAVSDTNYRFCVYVSGGNLYLKNRLGTSISVMGQARLFPLSDGSA
jgi:hypothetical protein